jgi:SAM-dependent methyltransferase
MYNDIADIYLEIFPLNQAFLSFIPEFLGEPGSTILDLGCGPGDYVDHFSRAGYQTTGIDQSDVMIVQAQENKQGNFYNYSFAEINQLNGKFDCAYCVGNSLSYLPADALAPFLQDVHNLLKTAGFFVLQVVNWDWLCLTMTSDFPVNKISSGRTFHRHYEWIDQSNIIFHTELRRDQEVLGSWADPLFPKYFRNMIIELQATGFAMAGQFGDYAKSLFDSKSSPALILVAQKNT